MKTSTARGFTLIELLVVIAIIGLLSSIVIASLNTARNKANDAKRRSDLISLRTALELYYTKNGHYPSTGGAWYGAAAPVTVQADWVPGLVADSDISKLPQDPRFVAGVTSDIPGGCVASWPSMYIYRSIDGTGYSLLSHCPSASSVGNTSPGDGLYDAIRPTWAWKVCVGPECDQ